MQELSMERAKAIYRAAVDSRASEFEEPAWWEAVRTELRQVLSARTVFDAAAVIAWWSAARPACPMCQWVDCLVQSGVGAPAQSDVGANTPG